MQQTKDRYVRLHVPRNNVLGTATIIQMRQRKLQIIEELRHSKRGNKKTITYGDLHEKLRGFGYKEFYVKGNGKEAISFENDVVPSSRILLPIREKDDEVEEFYLNRTWMILRACGILEETNPLLS